MTFKLFIHVEAVLFLSNLARNYKNVSRVNLDADVQTKTINQEGNG